MRNQACEPCAKRKVRCDRAAPACSNCKRRKKDRCVYPDVSPDERIKRLEETVRQLGGDPLATQTAATAATPAICERTPASTGADTPSVHREDERSIYLESQGWQAWVNITRGRDGGTHLGSAHAHRPAMNLPHAFQGSPVRRPVTSTDISNQLPFAKIEATRLWDCFRQRVNPILKLSFKTTLDRLQSSVADTAQYKELSSGERCLLIVACYFGVVSLARGECMEVFGRSKSALLAEYRQHSEDSFADINMFTINDIDTLKALCLYVQANVDRVTSQSLWSLMGLVCRSAELMGIHRDGEALGLAPIDIEERRRLWWQIQHIDLIMAVKNGSTPMTFTADWDAKLPLNIEDDDISPGSKTLPEERTGLTELSYTYFTYWVMYQQRRFRVTHQQPGVDQSLLGNLTDRLIDELEAGLQARFLQYCDPTRPVHAILQIAARALICLLRLRAMHEVRLTATAELDEKFHSEYFSLCMQELGYTIAGFSNPALKPFHWLCEASCVWHALIAMIVDLPHLKDTNKIKAAWALLGDLYAAAAFLKDFTGDDRRLRAAELIIAAWAACVNKPGLESMQRPAFITELEQGIAACGPAEDTGQEDAENDEPAVIEPGQSMTDLLDFNFADIEWSFWQ